MRVAALLLAASALWGTEEAREIVRRSVQAARANEKLARSYTYIERQDVNELDDQGRSKRRQIKTYDVTLREGTPYRRLIARDDKPLPPDRERQELDKMDKDTAQRRAETPEQRAKRVAGYEKRRQRERAFLDEVNDAFDFRLLGEERLENRDLWIIEATPRPGYRPHNFATRFLARVKGKLWIDKSDYAWVNTEAEVIDTVTMGAFLLRLHKGARFSIRQTRVNGEVWLPRQIRLSGSARIALFKKFAADMDITYRDYRKFSSDSRVLSFDPQP